MKLQFVKKIDLFSEKEDIINRYIIKHLFDCINMEVLVYVRKITMLHHTQSNMVVLFILKGMSV